MPKNLYVRVRKNINIVRNKIIVTYKNHCYYIGWNLIACSAYGPRMFEYVHTAPGVLTIKRWEGKQKTFTVTKLVNQASFVMATTYNEVSRKLRAVNAAHTRLELHNRNFDKDTPKWIQAAKDLKALPKDHRGAVDYKSQEYSTFLRKYEVNT